MSNKKMFACFVFFQNGEVKRWKYVTNLNSFEKFLNTHHPKWRYFNVYEKGTKQYLKRFYPGNIIPKLLGLFLLFLFSCLPARKNTFSETTFNKTTFTNGFNNTATIQNLHNQKMGVQCL